MSTIVETSIGKFDSLLHQMIGVVGWIDTLPPAVTFYGWLILVAALLGLALTLARSRVVVTLGALVVAVVVLPVVIEASKAATDGFPWQGRYTLPLAVGIPILAAVGISDGLATRFEGRLVRVVISIVLVAQAAMFWVALRRFTVGLDGPLLPFGRGWQPPLGEVIITVGFMLALIAYGFLMSRWWTSVIEPEKGHLGYQPDLGEIAPRDSDGHPVPRLLRIGRGERRRSEQSQFE